MSAAISKKIGFKLKPVENNIVEAKAVGVGRIKKSSSRKKRSIPKHSTVKIYLVDNKVVDRLNKVESQIIKINRKELNIKDT